MCGKEVPDVGRRRAIKNTSEFSTQPRMQEYELYGVIIIQEGYQKIDVQYVIT